MIDHGQLLTCVIRPVLKDIEAYSESAERLLLGTACQETECGRWLTQRADGSARGIYQIEGPTFKECIKFLRQPGRLLLLERVRYWAIDGEFEFDQLAGNLYFATAIARVNYMRFSEPIPDNLLDQAAYYKRYWNTELGKATEEEYINNWNRFVAHHLFV